MRAVAAILPPFWLLLCVVGGLTLLFYWNERSPISAVVLLPTFLVGWIATLLAGRALLGVAAASFAGLAGHALTEIAAPSRWLSRSDIPELASMRATGSGSKPEQYRNVTSDEWMRFDISTHDPVPVSKSHDPAHFEEALLERFDKIVGRKPGRTTIASGQAFAAEGQVIPHSGTTYRGYHEIPEDASWMSPFTRLVEAELHFGTQHDTMENHLDYFEQPREVAPLAKNLGRAGHENFLVSQGAF